MTVNIPSSSKGKRNKKTVIKGVEEVEYDVDELTDSYSPKPLQEYLIKYIIGKLVSFHSKNALTLLKHLGRFLIVRIWWVIFRN